MRIEGKIKKTIYGHLPEKLRAFPYFGTKVYFPKKSFLFHAACCQGIYELQNVQLIRRLIRPNSVYMDIGANIGLMALPILQSHPSCKVISWEPSPNTLPFLQRTVENSPYQKRWSIIEKAAGANVGNLEFSIASAELGAYDGFQDTQRSGEREKVNVEVTTIDEEWHALGKPDISLIKLDIEGAELQALNGAKGCLSQQKPYLLIEWNAENIRAYKQSKDDIISFANEINYQVLSIPDLIPISNLGILDLYMLETEYFLLIPNLSRQ